MSLTTPVRLRVLPALLPVNGREIELRVSDEGMIQQRYGPDEPWRDIANRADLRGDIGPKTELRYNGSYIQYRPEGDGVWSDLVLVDDLVSPYISALQGNLAIAVEDAQRARDLAQDFAGDTVAQGNVPIFASRSTASTFNLTAFRSVIINRFTSSDRLAPTVYAQVDEEPVHELSFRDAAGNWFEANADRISIYAAGAKGDGVTDDWGALKRLEAFAHPGLTIEAVGDFYAAYRSHLDQNNWINLSHSGLSIEGERGATRFKNFLFLILGKFGQPLKVGSGFTRNDKRVNSEIPHGLVKDGFVQLVSGINAYTKDAGSWQNGSRSPTSNNLPTVRFSEIHRLSAISSPTEAVLYDRVIFPGYRPNTDGQAFPIENVPSAEIRRLDPVVGVTFRGVTFETGDFVGFRTILIRCAVDVLFDECEFVAGTTSGANLKTTDVYGLTLRSCTAYSYPLNASGSTFNRFFFGAGTQKLVFEGCRFRGGNQIVDVSNLMLDGDPGHSATALRCGGLTSQGVKVTGCLFEDGENAFTTHPGTYDLTFADNVIDLCRFGLQARSRGNMIANNVIRASRSCLAFSGFYEDTVAVGNNLKRSGDGTEGNWLGVSFANLTSETCNSNNFQNVLIAHNTFDGGENFSVGGGAHGVFWRHDGQGVPANANFTEFNDEVKTALSRYVIRDNEFRRCGVFSNRWFNGLAFLRNEFFGGCSADYYILTATNVARVVAHDNRFDGLKPAIFVSTTPVPAYPYDTSHEVIQTASARGAALQVSLANLNSSSYFDVAGAGSPEGVVDAPIGSLYHRTDPGSGPRLFVKESGVGKTGWVAK